MDKLSVYYDGRIYEGVDEMPSYAKKQLLVQAYLYNKKMQKYDSYVLVGKHPYENGDIVNGKYHIEYSDQGIFVAMHGKPNFFKKPDFVWSNENIVKFIKWYLKSDVQETEIQHAMRIYSNKKYENVSRDNNFVEK